MSTPETSYTAKEAARILGIALRATRSYCASGELKCEKVGNAYLIYESDLMRFKEELQKRGKRRGPVPLFMRDAE